MKVEKRCNSLARHLYLWYNRKNFGDKMKNNSYNTIVFDGPAGAGKSTLAQEIAKRHNYLFFSTGLLYRSVTYACLYHGVNIFSEESVSTFIHYFELNYVPIDTLFGKQLQIVFKGYDITDLLHSPRIDKCVGIVSQYPQVREYFRKIQRNLANKTDMVMEGRDIGTVVLPNAYFKFFITASIDARARRRYEKEKLQSFFEIKSEIIKRDKLDTERHSSPLVMADDAILVDTSDSTVEQSIGFIEQYISYPKCSIERL